MHKAIIKKNLRLSNSQRNHLNLKCTERGGALIEVLIATALFLSVTAGLVGAFAHTELLWVVICDEELTRKNRLNDSREEMMTDSYDQTWADVQEFGPLSPIM
jgi:hypothetical protein